MNDLKRYFLVVIGTTIIIATILFLAWIYFFPNGVEPLCLNAVIGGLIVLIPYVIISIIYNIKSN